jgi:formiminoglutamase
MTETISDARAFHWTGRMDHDEGPAALRWHQRVDSVRSDATAYALLGFHCDAGVARNQGRVGAAKGPDAIRAALANMAWHHGPQRALDAGDVHCEGDALEAAQAQFGVHLAALLAESCSERPSPAAASTAALRIAGLGGGHEIAFASWLGLAEHAARQHSVPRIGILNFDAHFDLRSGRASSGTPFKQMSADCAARGWPFHYACLGVAQTANTQALFDQAKLLNVWWQLDIDMQEPQCGAVSERLTQFLAGIDWLYVSVCLDVFPAAAAPGVSAPSTLGVPVATVLALLARLKASGKLRYLDIAELNPQFDRDQRTAKLAARIVWEYFH